MNDREKKTAAEDTAAENNERENANTFYAIALRGVVAFPKMVIHLDIARDRSIKAVELALKGSGRVFLTAQQDPGVDEPDTGDLFRIGVVAEIKQVLRLPNSIVKVLAEGVYKAAYTKLYDDGDVLRAEVRRMAAYSRAHYDANEAEALMRSIKDVFERYATYFPRMPKEMILAVMTCEEPVELFENIAFNCSLNFRDKQRLLEEPGIINKLGLLYACLVQETQILEIENEITEQAKSSIESGQREFFLREQMRAIQEQLGEFDGDDYLDYSKAIFEMKADEKIQEKLLKEAEKLSKLPPASQEAFVIKNYLDTVLELPWGKYSRSKLSMEKAEAVLEKDHYGLKKVKERILEFLAVHMLNPGIKGQIICLAGPPGVGKTSVAKSVARAMGRKYARVSLGGVRDEADIRGHRKTYVGAMPGRVITALTQAGTANPLILFDEIDKLCSDMKGDPSSAMLEVLDSEQNSAFRDHFIEVPFDLSKAVFITTANNIADIPAPLLDRLERIELPSYTAEEKYHIAKEHLVPKQLREHGLKASQMKITEKALRDVIRYYTREAGVRSLERVIASLCRKTARKIAGGEASKVSIKPGDLHELLGARKYISDLSSEKDQVGVVNGLAWSAAGGAVMPLEAIAMPGGGKVVITGSLGQVMKESSQIAISYARCVAEKYGYPTSFLSKCDMHIHAPEGAIPKDGPSAGAALATVIISVLSGYPVRSDVAMTGEITLHGKVLPIGGLREKSMAAYTAGIKKVIIPADNVPDLEEVDDAVKEAVEFIPVSELSEVLDIALVTVDDPVKLACLHKADKQEDTEKKASAEDNAETEESNEA